ncbi:MAG: hypothetical protein MH204_12100, partial [Fimbriimonadaceae bacterium]|nr:hypothetical protein [Fimbriimonadaceae bacterium]
MEKNGIFFKSGRKPLFAKRTEETVEGPPDPSLKGRTIAGVPLDWDEPAPAWGRSTVRLAEPEPEAAPDAPAAEPAPESQLEASQQSMAFEWSSVVQSAPPPIPQSPPPVPADALPEPEPEPEPVLEPEPEREPVELIDSQAAPEVWASPEAAKED